MAHFHLHASHGSRSGGQSAGAKADYITREGRYAQRPGLVLVESGNLPDWAGSAREFWSAADTYSRANARLYTEVEMALPRELDLHAQVQLAQEMVDELATIDGARIPYTWALHDSGDGNPHVHVVLSAKADDGYQRTPAQWFARAASTGRPAQSGGARSWSEATDKVWLESRRESWATRQNQAYELAGLDVRVDHRSYARRGIEQAPTMHEGWAPRRKAQMQRYNAQVREINAELSQARQVVHQLAREHERSQPPRPSFEEVRTAELKRAQVEAIKLYEDTKAAKFFYGKDSAVSLYSQKVAQATRELHAWQARQARLPQGLSQDERDKRLSRSDLPRPPGYQEASHRHSGDLPLPPGHPDRADEQQQQRPRSRSHSHKM